MDKKLFIFLCVALAVSLLLGTCAPAATPETAPTGTTDVQEIIPDFPREVTEAPIMPEPTQPPVITEPPAQEIFLVFKALKGIANLNGNQVYDGEMKAGDALTTDTSSFVQVEVAGDDRASFEIKPGSVIKVEMATSSTIRLFLEVGSIRTSVKDGSGLRVVIAAGAGESEAGGTTWISEVDQTGALVVAVLQGRVIARAPDGYEVAVNEKEQLNISKDGVPGWPQSTVFIYFDAALDDFNQDVQFSNVPFTLWTAYSRMASELLSAGYVIEDSADLSYIGGYDILIIVDPEQGWDESNIQAVQNWVESGHGLFLVGEWPGNFNREFANRLLYPFGISFLGDTTAGKDVADSFADHEVTMDVKQLYLLGYSNLSGGTPLGYTGADEAILTSYDNGQGGRVLVLSDSDVLTNLTWESYPDYSQATFILNAIHWLAGEE